MSVLTCNACNKEFDDDAQQKLHCCSEWHRYNLKRKVAGVPGVTEELFHTRQSTLAERGKSGATEMFYSCVFCEKEYKSEKAYAQHLNLRAHILKAPQELDPSAAGTMIDDIDEVEELDTSSCFVCDLKLDNIKSCMVHMHKQHGFFIPDIEYLDDPNGLLTYVGHKVKRDFMCLYCNDRCHPFQSLEAVRKHMIAKGHCKLRYGDGDDEEDVNLEEFYDYSKSYVDVDGKQLMSSYDMSNNIELGSGGSELIITHKSENGIRVRTLGSREFLRYYRQKPHPSPARDVPLAVSLASRYRNMGLATVQSKEQIVRMKVLREMNRRGVETMRSKMGMKSNVIRNLPKNVPY